MPDIIVCLKVIIDPEAPASLFQIDHELKVPLAPKGMPPVFSPFDLNALEAALKIKDQQACTITVLSLGKNLPKALLQKALALGADTAVAVEDPGFEHLDPFSTSRALAAAVRRIGSFDLICTGRQAADWDGGLVWAGMAELLDVPCLTMARRADIHSPQIIVERCTSDGIEFMAADLPALVTFSSEVGPTRFASLQDMMKAGKKPIQRWKAVDIDFEPARIMVWEDLLVPEPPAIDCNYVAADTDGAAGRLLAQKLCDEGLIPTAHEVKHG